MATAPHLTRHDLITRRDLIQRGLGAGLGMALAGQAQAASSGTVTLDAASFSFVHITDTHIQPELGAARGVHQAFQAVRSLPEKPAFALVGGDLVMDALAASADRAALVFDLWQQAAADLALPTHYSVGNHDLYALSGPRKASIGPDYGKGLWKRRLGLDRSYAFFDHQGWRFVTLDSAGITPAGDWEGAIDDEQLRWLDGLLRGTAREMPLVFLTHFPIFTIYGQYTGGTTSALGAGMIVKNGKAFKELIQPYNVKAVFQGHTHVVEECTYLGVRYITGGAVCGDWWRGLRLGVHPEGFVAATVRGKELSWRYVSYGWKAQV